VGEGEKMIEHKIITERKIKAFTRFYELGGRFVKLDGARFRVIGISKNYESTTFRPIGERTAKIRDGERSITLTLVYIGECAK
jgi:hypothetical protein